MSELSTLFPQGKTIVIGDKEFTIKPFKLGQLPSVFKCIEPISVKLFSAINDQSINSPAVIVDLISVGGEHIIDLIKISTNETRLWVEELDLDQAVDVFTVILEVNADFFIHKVLPKLNQQMDRVKAAGQSQ